MRRNWGPVPLLAQLQVLPLRVLQVRLVLVFWRGVLPPELVAL